MRILHVHGNMNLGGAESRVMDLYRHMDRDRIQFDFMVHTADKSFYEDEIESLGGRIFRMPRFRVYNTTAYKSAWKAFFSEHPEIEVVHGHMTSTASFYLPIAKAAGVKMTIAHARSAGVDQGLKGTITRFLRRDLADKTEHCFACSTEAAISVFGRPAYEKGKTVFFPNAIDCGSFRFDPEVRDRMRKELGISDQFVIGHVGRFHYAKNHEYLLCVFAELLKKKDFCKQFDPVLILLGEGPLMEEMQLTAKALGIGDKVRFLGSHADIADYYQAMDLFLYPSRYEGMPGTVVEAQSNGLYTYMSDTITKDVDVTDLVEALDIEEEAFVWADRIAEDIGKIRDLRNDTDREKEYAEKMIKAGFDVGEQAKKLTEFYLTGNEACLK